MDARTAVAAVPLLRKAWRVLPGPLKLPVLLLGAIYALYRWRRDDDEGEGTPDASAIEPT